MAKKQAARGKAKQRRAARPSAARRPGGHLAIFDGKCREVLASEGRDVVRDGDPLQVELWVSTLLGMFAGLPLVGEDDPVQAIGGRLVSVARKAHAPAAQACLRGLAVLAEGRLRERAREALREVVGSGTAPAWFEAIGAAEATSAWRASDPWGDQDSVMVGFRYPGGDEHTITVLVDHALGGIAKDIAVLGRPGEVIDLWRSSSDLELVSEPISLAAARVVEAMDLTARMLGAPVSEDYAGAEALARSRFGPLAGEAPHREPMGNDQREALVKAFLSDPAGAAYVDDPQAWYILDLLVDYRCAYQGADPVLWSGGVAEMFLVDFVPRKASAEAETLGRVPDILTAWVRWGAARAGVPSHLADEVIEVIEEVRSEFASAILDEGRWGPAKRLAMEMMAEGVDLTDIDAANAWLDARTA